MKYVFIIVRWLLDIEFNEVHQYSWKKYCMFAYFDQYPIIGTSDWTRFRWHNCCDQC